MSNIYDLINYISAMDGNCSINDSVYISHQNMRVFSLEIKNVTELTDLLFTPFLIDVTTKETIYELHYYEFFIKFSSKKSVHYYEYEKSNKLPTEIIENIHPKVTIPKGNSAAYRDAVISYLHAMEYMKFETERQYLLSVLPVGRFELYFKIY